MTIFEKATVDAVSEIQNENISDYAKAWKESLAKYTKSEKTLAKGCPKNTFIDLCSFGYIKGIRKNDKKLSENGRKSITAIEILKKQGWYFNDKKKFWRENFKTNHQSQLDIILALKNADLLNL